MLQRYKALQDIIAILGMDELSEEDKLDGGARAQDRALPVAAVLRRRSVHRLAGQARRPRTTPSRASRAWSKASTTTCRRPPSTWSAPSKRRSRRARSSRRKRRKASNGHFHFELVSPEKLRLLRRGRSGRRARRRGRLRRARRARADRRDAAAGHPDGARRRRLSSASSCSAASPKCRPSGLTVLADVAEDAAVDRPRHDREPHRRARAARRQDRGRLRARQARSPGSTTTRPCTGTSPARRCTERRDLALTLHRSPSCPASCRASAF